MSSDAIARRLEEVRALNQLMQYLAGFRRSTLLDAIVGECRGHCDVAAPELAAFVEDVLHGSRNLLGALDQGLVTDAEVASALVARFDTWLAQRGATLLRADELVARALELLERR